MHFDEYFLPLSLFFRVAHVKGWLEILRAALLLAQPYCTLVLHDLPVRVSVWPRAGHTQPGRDRPVWKKKLLSWPCLYSGATGVDNYLNYDLTFHNVPHSEILPFTYPIAQQEFSEVFGVRVR